MVTRYIPHGESLVTAQHNFSGPSGEASDDGDSFFVMSALDDSHQPNVRRISCLGNQSLDGIVAILACTPHRVLAERIVPDASHPAAIWVAVKGTHRIMILSTPRDAFAPELPESVL